MAAAKKLTTREAILKVLASGEPMRVPEIIKQAIPLTAAKGKTPGQTVYSVLYTQLKRKGVVEQTGRGEFKLAANGTDAKPAKAAKPRRRAAAPEHEQAAEEAQS